MIKDKEIKVISNEKEIKTLSKFFFPKEEITIEAETMNEALTILKSNIN